ncbi:MAG TPA: CvpA family protein [Bacteroidetes bacterium]|nr:CvpA family protein [Bacteroidota bacterium]
MIIDGLLLIIAGWGFFQGYSRGIIKTVFTVFSFVFGLMVAFKLAPAATRFVETLTKSDHPVNFLIGFFLSFMLTMILVRMIAKFMERAMQSAHINIINQLAGGILLSSLYTLVFSTFVWFGDISHILSEEIRDTSMTYPVLKTFPKKMKGAYEYLKPSFQEFWQESVKFIDKMEEKSVEKTEDAPTIFDIPDEDQ